MAEGALTGLNVLDLTHYIAGPYCTKLLAGLGANVIKVERPGRGDPLRRVGPFSNDGLGLEESCPFLYLNTDKQGLTLDLKNATGRSMLKRLVEQADVLVESFRPGVMARLGLAYEELEKVNPGLVMVSVSNFGQTGPYRDFELTDMTAQAFGGLMNEIGEPDNVPLKLGGYQALYAAGVAAFTAAMTGVMVRNLKGIGQYIDVSIFEMVAYTEWHASSYYAYNGQVRRRLGRWNQWKILRCRDGHMGVVGQFPPIHQFLGAALDDERFATVSGRHENSLALGEAIESRLLDQDKLDLYHRGQEAGVPWGYVADMDDLITSPHYKARSFFRELDHPHVGRGVYPGQPFRVGDLPGGPWQPAPSLGQHNRSIYGELLGYSDDDLTRLHEMGII
jgi:CoA:oxalate CoA-transferase